MSYSNLHPSIDNPRDLWESKVGYDSVNKRMIARIAYALHDVVEFNMMPKPNWVNVVRYMFELENNKNGLNKIAVGGYYSTIRKILQDIYVIRYEGKKLKKGTNWDRFFNDYEDWSWFTTDTTCGGWGRVIK